MRHSLPLSMGLPALLLMLASAAAAATEITWVAASGTVVPRYGKFEVRFGLSSTYANPFDPNEIDAGLVVTTPAGDTLTVPAFWYQAYQRTSAGADEILTGEGGPCWMARFAPEDAGGHTYHISIVDSLGEARSADSAFTAVSSSDPGFVRRHPGDTRLFTCSDQTPYLPIGHNVAWATNLGTYDYDMYFDEMAAHGENWTRIWMTHFYRGQSLEWNSNHWTGYFHGLGVYSLECAWKLDHMIETARQQGIRIQLVTQHHGQFSTSTDANWSDNPYNAANGGMLTAPAQFFTNAEAKALYKRKLRYIIARWGYSTSILAWEFWNEVQYTDGYNAATVAAWHAEMGRYARSLDPWAHLLTTSARETDAVIWSLPEIDCTQLHLYVSEITNTVRSKALAMSAYAKPVIVGEFGYYPHTTGWADTDGTHLHNGIWSAAMAMTGAMLWWWDNYVHPNDLYYHFAGLGSFFEDEDLGRPPVSSVGIAVGGNAAARGFAIGGSTHAYLWVQDSNNEIGQTPQDSLRGVWVKVPGMAAGEYDVEFWNTYAGTLISSTTIWCAGDTLLVNVPAFHWDVAVKVRNAVAAGVGQVDNPNPAGNANPDVEIPPGAVICPNPFSASTTLILGAGPGEPGGAARQGGPVEVAISDVRGRIVWRGLADGAEIRWDGRDLTGVAVAPGTYFCTLAGAGPGAPGCAQVAPAKLVVLR